MSLLIQIIIITSISWNIKLMDQLNSSNLKKYQQKQFKNNMLKKSPSNPLNLALQQNLNKEPNVNKKNQSSNTPVKKSYKLPKFTHLKSLESYQSFRKSESRTQRDPKNRITPPLRRIIKSQKKMVLLPSDQIRKSANVVVKDDYLLKSKSKQFTHEEVANQIDRINKIHRQEVQNLKNMIAQLVRKRTPLKKSIIQSDENMMLIKKNQKGDNENLKTEVQYYKFLYEKTIKQKENMEMILKNNYEKIEKQKKRLQQEVQELKKKIILSKIKIDHIYSPQFYDKNKNNNVENKIMEIDQRYQISHIVSTIHNNQLLNSQYYNNQTKSINKLKRNSQNCLNSKKFRKKQKIKNEDILNEDKSFLDPAKSSIIYESSISSLQLQSVNRSNSKYDY